MQEKKNDKVLANYHTLFLAKHQRFKSNIKNVLTICILYFLLLERKFDIHKQEQGLQGDPDNPTK